MTGLELPLLGSQDSTKSRIVLALSREWPLSAQQIHQRVTRESEKPVTYQAVHKLLKELTDDGVLCREGTSYQLDKNWISRFKDFGQSLDTVYNDVSGKLKIPPDLSKPVRYAFNDASTLAVTLANIYAGKALTGGKSTPAYALFQHGIWPLRFSFSDFDLILRVNNAANSYVAILGDLPFDQWVAKQYRLGGFKKVKTGVGPAPFEGTFISQGDIVLQVDYSKESLRSLKRLYKEMDSISDLFFCYVQKKASKFSFKATVTIQKNKTYAKVIRETVCKLLELSVR